jgi:hypothetical protein
MHRGSFELTEADTCLVTMSLALRRTSAYACST